MIRFLSLILLLASPASTASIEDPFEIRGDYPFLRSEFSAPSPYIEDLIEMGVFSVQGSGPRPVVIFMGGFRTSYKEHIGYLEHLASHGFHAVGIDLPRTGFWAFLFEAAHDRNAREMSTVLDYVLTGTIDALPLDSIRSQQVAVAGHSLGGKIAFYAASRDPRVRLVLGLDPSNSGGAPCALNDFIGGDCNAFPVADNPITGQKGVMETLEAEAIIFRAPPGSMSNPDHRSNALEFWESLPTGGYFFDFETGHHDDWVSNEPVKRITRRTMTAFLKQEFEGADATPWLDGTLSETDAEAGIRYSVYSK